MENKELAPIDNTSVDFNAAIKTITEHKEPEKMVEIMQKLIDMRNAEKKENARIAFMTAMHKAQSEFPRIIKTEIVDTGKYSYPYATLPQIQSAIDPIIRIHGLSYYFSQEESDGKVTITCTVSHVGGHYIDTKCTLQKLEQSRGMNSMQVGGASNTYAKRTAIGNAFGLNIDKDTDAVAYQKPAPTKPVKQPTKTEIETLKQEVLANLDEALITNDENGKSLITREQRDSTIAGIDARGGGELYAFLETINNKLKKKIGLTKND